MDNIQNPIVSVVMATYNRMDSLEHTIKFILNQSYKNIELVIVNDGSSDNTALVLDRLKNTENFVVITNNQNLGLQKSLNIGVKNAKGKYIARIDDHDEWIDSEKIEKQIIFLEKNRTIGLVGTAYKHCGKIIYNPISDSDIRSQILMRSPFCHVSIVMLRSIFDKVGGYDESLSYSEDWDLWLRVGKVCEMANLSDICVNVVEEETSLSSDYFLKQLPINRQIVKRNLESYPNRIKASLYHQFIRLFFAIFPLDGIAHSMMKRVFVSSFALKSQKKYS